MSIMVALAEIPFCHKATTGGRAKPGKAINAVAFCRRRACEKKSFSGKRAFAKKQACQPRSYAGIKTLTSHQLDQPGVKCS